MKLHSRIGAALTASALAGTALAAAPASAGNNLGGGPIPSGATTVNLLTVNDFHGRIADYNTTSKQLDGSLGKNFACAVVTQQAALGEASLIGVGDLIGASAFPSAAQKDIPTIDYFNALGMKTSSVGNHEFDQGYPDLRDRVEPHAQFTYTAANVAGSSLKTYDIIEIDGLRVAIIGAVTSDVPNLVAGAGIAGLTFTDPVAAVNKVADDLTDGDVSNGEADLLIAAYHEGGPRSTPATLADNSTSPIFAHLVNDTSPKVAAILNAHTHQTYSYDAPVPGATDGSTRPVLQAANYASRLGKIQLGIDPSTKKVVGYNANVVAVTAATPECAANPVYTAAAGVVDAAVSYAKPLFEQKIGSATAPITRAKVNGAEDRTRESTLSNLIAQQYVDSVTGLGVTTPDIGIMNPGGVRADLAQGDVTVGQAAAIMPFGNTIKTAVYTGAQFKQILEEQWPATGLTRSFLAMGVSKNVTYTIDPTKPWGERITSVMLDGSPIDPEASYVIASNSFLMTNVGGPPDGFAELLKGRDYKDSGLVDQNAFIDWITANSPLTPSFAKQSAFVQPSPSDWTAPIFATLTAGESATVTVEGTDLTSESAPANTEFTVFLGDREVGKAPITSTHIATPLPTRDGASTVTFEVPQDLAISQTMARMVSGPMILRLVAAPSGTTIFLPVTVQADVTDPTTDPGETSPPATIPAAGSGAGADPGTGSAVGGASSAMSSSGGLAWTGANVFQLLGLVAVLVLGGAFLIVIARRRASACH